MKNMDGYRKRACNKVTGNKQQFGPGKKLQEKKSQLIYSGR